MTVAVNVFTHFHILFIMHRNDYKEMPTFLCYEDTCLLGCQGPNTRGPLGDVHVVLRGLVLETLCDRIGLDQL